MTNDYWELLTTDDNLIRGLSVWIISHTDLVDLVNIEDNWLQLRIIPDYIIPRFSEYRGFIELCQKSTETLKVMGYFGVNEYSIGFYRDCIEMGFKNFSPISIDLTSGKLSVWVIDGGTGKRSLVSGLSPMNYSSMQSFPESFPRFVRIGYEHEKGIHNYT